MTALLNTLSVLIIVVPILLAVAFMTLVERKVLSAMQRRVGPNTVGMYGVGQPFADALKLLTKEIIVPQHASKGLFFMAPALSLILAILSWAVLPLGPGLAIADMELGVLYTLALSSIGVYGVLLTGWAGNNAFSFLGGIRTTSSMISYELVLGTVILTVLLISGSFSYVSVVEYQLPIWNGVPLFPVALLFALSATFELSRAPADLPEAESELVAGFFTEAGAAVFVSSFLAEYTSIVMMSTLLALLFMGGSASGEMVSPLGFISLASVILGLKACVGCFSIVWIRAVLPRVTFITLLQACWTYLLPLAIACLVLCPSLLVAFDVTV